MYNFITDIKNWLKNFIDNNCLRIISNNLLRFESRNIQKSPEYIRWVNYGLVEQANDFYDKYNLNNSYFVKKLSHSFKSNRFELLVKRWIVDYLFSLFNLLHDRSYGCFSEKVELSLEDNLLNHFAVEQFFKKFDCTFKIIWKPKKNLLHRLISILILGLYVFLYSIKSGVKFYGRKKKYKLLREAIWGLYDIGGYFFHDDFLVDEKNLKKTDLLLFSRSKYIWESGRQKAYYDASKSNYAHFYLPSLKLRIDFFFSRILPKYIFGGSLALLRECMASNFSLFETIYWFFIKYALPYENIFSNFSVISELGQNYFSANHIPESIVCQSFGTKYYLMHWSDNALKINNFGYSFLGCDKYLLWGRAHFRGVEGPPSILLSTGYVFKRFVQKVKSNSYRTLLEMGIVPQGKIITFFDETFGGFALMTEQHYTEFWKTALLLAQLKKQHTILIKPKVNDSYKKLSSELKREFEKKRRDILKETPNVHIIDSQRWSFIESIGVSDIVVSQGMTSSSTIALICGIEALYFDQANYEHPFSKEFRDIIVFNDRDKLFDMISLITDGKDSALKRLPTNLLRKFDAYSDDRGIDLFREVLVN